MSQVIMPAFIYEKKIYEKKEFYVQKETKQFMDTMINCFNQVTKIYDQLWQKLSILSEIKRLYSGNNYTFLTTTEAETGSFMFNLKFYVLGTTAKKGYFALDVRFYPKDRTRASFYTCSVKTNNYLLNHLYNTAQQKRIVKELIKLYVSYYRSAVYSKSNF